MFTAKKAREAITKTLETCEGLDVWIEDYLVEQFLKGGGHEAVIHDSVVSDNGWGVNTFISAMRLRGFTVEYYCEDRPCGSCYYTITIPM